MSTDTTIDPQLPKASNFNEDENPVLTQTPEGDTPVQEWLLNYVGDKLQPKNGEVTVSMIVDVLADEFPDFVLALAEENWLRGYRQGIADVEAGRQAIQEEVNAAALKDDTSE